MSQITDALIARAIQLLGISTGQYTLPYQSADWPAGSEPWRGMLIDYADTMRAAMATTDITPEEVQSLSPDAAFGYISATFQHIQSVGGALLEAVKAGNVKSVITTIPRMQLRASVVAIYVYNMSGVQLHLSGAFARGIQAGRITEHEAAEHLNRCLDLCQAYAALAGKNALALINRPASGPTSGLGVTGWDDAVALGALAIAGLLAVLLLLGVCFIIAWAYNQHYVQTRALDECDRLLEQGDAAGSARCRANVLTAANQPMDNLMSSLLTPLQVIGYTAAGALALYVGVKFIWPAVTEQHRRALPGGV